MTPSLFLSLNLLFLLSMVFLNMDWHHHVGGVQGDSYLPPLVDGFTVEGLCVVSVALLIHYRVQHHHSQLYY